MFDKGFIYEDYMPVYWSPSSRSALAEAELEYNEHHRSKSVYVKFLLSKLPEQFAHILNGDTKVNVVVWTTTPWTLPANKAVSYGRNIKYAMAQDKATGAVYLVSEAFLDKLQNVLGTGAGNLDILHVFEGEVLQGLYYVHPLWNTEMPLLAAHHVTTEKGTGLVHTAPAHGQEDFQVALSHDLSLDCIVDSEGKYTKEAGEALEGQDVLGSGNEKVIQLLNNCILCEEVIEHSYPYDWRTKQPVIMRACKQWFVDTSKIKTTAMECIENDVSIMPKNSGHGMLAMLQRRSYWCISRQRAWGVPIPVFYEKATGNCLLSRASAEHVFSVVRQKGTDAWWTMSVNELLPPHVKEQSGFDKDAEFEKGTDILDIWFDSGCTWAHILGDEGVSDVYLEGLDQFGGWFQSSLLTSVAVRGYAPYRALVVHGFAVDEDGKKMSKSLGNVVDPQTVINGSKTEPAYGADVLRWWAARANLDTVVEIGPTVLERCHEQIFRVRKNLRYLLANLFDFKPKQDQVPYQELPPQDRYTLHLLYKFISAVTTSYEEYNYSRVANLVEKFINSDVSGFYCHITKDRLYCEVSSETPRRSAQTVQFLLLEALLKVIAPVVPHLAEEFFMYHPFTEIGDSIFKTQWCQANSEWNNEDLQRTFNAAFQVRDAFNGAIPGENPIEYDLKIYLQNEGLNYLSALQPEESSTSSCLVEVFQSSAVSLLYEHDEPPPQVNTSESKLVQGFLSIIRKDASVVEEPFSLLIQPAARYICERCRRYTADTYAMPCDRCSTVMTHGWDQ